LGLLRRSGEDGTPINWKNLFGKAGCYIYPLIRIESIYIGASIISIQLKIEEGRVTIVDNPKKSLTACRLPANNFILEKYKKSNIVKEEEKKEEEEIQSKIKRSNPGSLLEEDDIANDSDEDLPRKQ